MDKIFSEMFSKQPDEIINDDFYYNTDYDIWYESIGILQEELRGLKEDIWVGQGLFKLIWGEGRTRIPEAFNTEVVRVCAEISAEGKPFMEIGCGEGMGFAPFIVKMNPKISCLATDIDPHLIKCWRLFINRDLAEYKYNIDLASFDNNCMPIKDNSLDYVTCYFGMDRGKQINEIYRVLKPGGRAILMLSYNERNFNMAKIYEDCRLCEKLFGIYTYSEIEEAWSVTKRDYSMIQSWHDEVRLAGFEIEIEKKHPERVSADEIRTYLYELTDRLKIRKWTDAEKMASLLFRENRKNSNETEEDFGIEFIKGEIFYVLCKPDKT